MEMQCSEDKTLLVSHRQGAQGTLAERVFAIAQHDGAHLDSYDVLELDIGQTPHWAPLVETITQLDLSPYSAVILDPRLPNETADKLMANMAPQSPCIVATSDMKMEDLLKALRLRASRNSVVSSEVTPMEMAAKTIPYRSDQAQQLSQSERLASIGLAVASVAHESRNALQRIQAHLDLLRINSGNSSDQLKDLESIENANHSLRVLFEELQDFSAPINLNRTPTMLRKVIDNSWASLHYPDIPPRAGLELDIDDQICLIDPVRMEQVFRNLMENAIDASERPITIRIVAANTRLHSQPALKITVRDNGPGFDAEDQETLFQPFFTTKKTGTGLGLPICQRIVEAHGGLIEADLSATSGASIRIILPLDDRPSEAS